LVHAIGKLPKYKGVVYRGAFFPRRVVEEMIARRKLVDPGFLSASQTDRALPVYDKYDSLKQGQVRILFTIKSKSGRIFGELSNMLGIEEEIVFHLRTAFGSDKGDQLPTHFTVLEIFEMI
jgi:hypothetical protein